MSATKKREVAKKVTGKPKAEITTRIEDGKGGKIA